MSAPTPTLLNGTNAVSSISVNNALYDCVMGSWQAQARSQKFPQTTFCSGGYEVTVKGLKAIDVTCAGFMSKGNAISDPLANFTTPTGVPCIWQADTNCTLSGTFHIDPAFGIVAAAISSEAFLCTSTGSFSTSWTVA